MTPYVTLTRPVRLISAALAFLATTLVLGGSLSLFDPAAADAVVQLAQGHPHAAAPLATARAAQRPSRG